MRRYGSLININPSVFRNHPERLQAGVQCEKPGLEHCLFGPEPGSGSGKAQRSSEHAQSQAAHRSRQRSRGSG